MTQRGGITIDIARDGSQEELDAAWQDRGIDTEALVVDGKGTIVPMALDAAVIDPVTTLPPLATRRVASAPPEVEMGRPIGKGGMGIVWAAEQPSLRREVAVKSVRDDVTTLEITHQLLQEARVTGALEHPNVVPIHALGRDEGDRPLIVMKRIEGTTWEELLEEQHSLGPGSLLRKLERNLDILLDVAKAASFAHSRGIIHRDIKPANVMIGAFGEVYLVDWGIAVSTREPGLGGAPLARDVAVVAGSPAYMVPEMAIAAGDRLNERTDVYLLGATLHDLLTGEPPHQDETPRQMLVRAYLSVPQTYDAAVPIGLANICRKAMARDPDDRYPTAAAFAASLQEFIDNQGSVILAAEATAKLESLRDAIAVAASGAEVDLRPLYNLFNACRFSFQNALRIWPDNTLARDQLQGALEMMIGFELDHGSTGAAANLLAELPQPSPQLSARLERRQAEKQQAESELESLRHRVDATAADRPRAYLAFTVAGIWLLTHGPLAYLEATTTYAVGHRELGLVYALFVIGSIAAGAAQRDTLLTRAAAGLKTQIVITLCYAVCAAVWPVCWALEVGVEGGFALMALVAAAMWTAGAATVDRRLLANGVTMLAGLAAVLWAPERAIIWLGIAGTTGATVLGWLRFRTRSTYQTQPLSERWAQDEVDEVARTLKVGRR